MHNKKIPTFKQWVHIELIQRGWSIKKLAMLISYPRETVSAALNNSKFPYVLSAIATILNHDPKKHSPIPTSPARPEKRVRSKAQ